MEFNSLIFRPPLPTYTFSRFGPELIWIPKSPKLSIPCLFLKSNKPTSKIFLFFHANAEDLGKIYEFLDILRCVFDINVMAPEYPGYGLYKGSPSCKKIEKDCEIIYKFLCSELNIDSRSVFIIGRSIGTGPATKISQHGVGSLILLSPFTSLRKIVKRLVGSFLQYLVKDRFKNIKVLRTIECPILLIHGKKDSLIPFQHSEELVRSCGKNLIAHFSETMTHNVFDCFEDIITPIDNFFRQFGIEVTEGKRIDLPDELSNVPDYIQKQQELLTEFL